MQATSRAEAERLLAIAENLLEEKDLNAARDFALLAQETDPLLTGSDQIMAIADVLLAADQQINNNNNNWYAILQIEIKQTINKIDSDLIKQQYRRLAILLDPDNNKFPFAGDAFKLVGDAWNVLSDPLKKSGYDEELFEFLKVDLDAIRNQKEKLIQNPPEKSPENRNSGKEAAAANKFPIAGDSLNVLSDPAKKSGSDEELIELSKVDLDAIRNRKEKLIQNSSVKSPEIRNSGKEVAAEIQNPPANKFPIAGDSVNVLSDPAKKSASDEKLFEFSKEKLIQNPREKSPESRNSGKQVAAEKSFEFSKLDLDAMKNRKENEIQNPPEKLPENRNSGKEGAENIWTPCPYCYNLFEYPRVFDGYCLRCANCERAFQVVAIPAESMPPLVPGKEAYYFPMRFAVADSDTGKTTPVSDSLPKVNMVPVAESGGDLVDGRPPEPRLMPESEKKSDSPTTGGTRKRGRPTKNPLL